MPKRGANGTTARATSGLSARWPEIGAAGVEPRQAVDHPAGEPQRHPEAAAHAARERGHGEVAVAAVERVHERGQRARRAGEVAVAEHERRAAPPPFSSCCAASVVAPPLPIRFGARTSSAPAPPRDLRRAVARRVVGHGHARARERLAQRRERLAEPLLLVVRAHDHADVPVHGGYRAASSGPETQEAQLPDVEAHITGTVWKIECQVGQEVEEGDTLVILESMKMEMPVEAEDDGKVAEIRVEEGQSVSEGDTLVVLE